MQQVFVTADTHFGHENILKYEHRPFKNVRDMDKKLIANWNSVVKKNDIIYILGDFSFYNKANTEKIVKQLHGRKILIMGNHDRDRSVLWWSSVGIDEVYRHPIVYDNYTIMSHEPPEYYNDATPYVYLYGHVHKSEMYKTCTKQTACVCTERWGFQPVLLSKIYEMIIAAR